MAADTNWYHAKRRTVVQHNRTLSVRKLGYHLWFIPPIQKWMLQFRNSLWALILRMRRIYQSICLSLPSLTEWGFSFCSVVIIKSCFHTGKALPQHLQKFCTLQELLLIFSEQLGPALQYCLDKLLSTAAVRPACLQMDCTKTSFHSSIFPVPQNCIFWPTNK